MTLCKHRLPLPSPLSPAGLSLILNTLNPTPQGRSSGTFLPPFPTVSIIFLPNCHSPSFFLAGFLILKKLNPSPAGGILPPVAGFGPAAAVADPASLVPTSQESLFAGLWKPGWGFLSSCALTINPVIQSQQVDRGRLYRAQIWWAPFGHVPHPSCL